MRSNGIKPQKDQRVQFLLLRRTQRRVGNGLPFYGARPSDLPTRLSGRLGIKRDNARRNGAPKSLYETIVQRFEASNAAGLETTLRDPIHRLTESVWTTAVEAYQSPAVQRSLCSEALERSRPKRSQVSHSVD